MITLKILAKANGIFIKIKRAKARSYLIFLADFADCADLF